MSKLFIVTTVPITLTSILSGQPKFLSEYFEVNVISSPDKELNEVCFKEGVRVFPLKMNRKISIFDDISSLLKMILILIRNKPDIIHSYTPKAGLIAMLAGFITRTPVRIHTFTGLVFPTQKGFKKQLLILIDKLICFCATNVVPEGNGVKKTLLEYSITGKSLNLIGNGNIAGVDTNHFRRESVAKIACEFKEKLDLPPKSFLFCFIGRFTKDKGFFEMIDAFECLPNSAHLLLVGEQDKRLPLPDEFIDKLNSNSRIHFTGFLTDVRPALYISDILLLPSYREGFPNTPLQAGSMEVPCIVSDISGCNEIIENGVNGWIVPPKNSEALRYSMYNAMHEEPKLLKSMGASSRYSTCKKFEKADYLIRLLGFYNLLLDKKNEKDI